MDLEEDELDEQAAETLSPRFSRLAIASGGTGGHFYPGLSVAREFHRRGGKVLMLLSGKHTEQQSQIAENYGIETVVIKSSQRPDRAVRYVGFAFDIFDGVWSARSILRRFRPDAMLGMGSFATFTASLAARMLNIPIFLHEGNARIGTANRFISRWARHLAISFPPVNRGACRCPVTCTGMPVRPELLQGQKVTKEKAIELLNQRHKCNFSPTQPVLLIFGGSQGAQVFNQAIPEALKQLGRKDLQVIHLTGKGKLDEVKLLYVDTEFPWLALAEIPYMDVVYSASDLIICRSGASSIAEITLFNKYSVLAPYPFAAEKHQDDNAAVMAAAGASTVIKSDEFSAVRIRDFLSEWVDHQGEYAEKAKNCAYVARPEATVDLLRLIEENLVGIRR